MNKSDLIDALTEKLGDRRTAAAAVDGVIDAITRAVAAGERVSLTGFGVFEKQVRAARTGLNPATQQLQEFAEKAVPKFRPGQGFKNVVSGAVAMAESAPMVARSAADAVVDRVPGRRPSTRSTPAARVPAPKAPAAKGTAKKSSPTSTSTAQKQSTGKKSTGTAKSTPAAKKSTAKKSAAKKSASS